jgi:carbamoyltransferase
MTYTLGISAGYHDGALSVVDNNGNIIFAAHSERYSKVKNDPGISPDLVHEISHLDINAVAYYERPWMHNLQQWRSSQKKWTPWTTKQCVAQYLPRDFLEGRDIKYLNFPHHLSHAAAGFQTSEFNSAAVVVIDAIGELDTISIYRAWYDRGHARYKRVWRQSYPHSIGLFYSAITARVGLRPMEEEYITMGMAAYGSTENYCYLRDRFVRDVDTVEFRENLHIGISHSDFTWITNENMAASAQLITEELVMSVMLRAKQLTGISNLVYMGGVALNCVANSRLGKIFNQIWIMPNPGDAGSSLGAAALAYGGRLTWRDAFLGHDIPGEYPVQPVIQALTDTGIAAVASGRAEFGPRALGNRSLLADPRGTDIKDRVNDIKRRQRFRPFAPVILEEHAEEYFDMPRAWSINRYMQSVGRCRRPDLYPAICHVDGTSRVQTVPQDGSGIRRLLETWHAITGCPMLLNTSLNIRGEPMVNDRTDADRWQRRYQLPVFS